MNQYEKLTVYHIWESAISKARKKWGMGESLMGYCAIISIYMHRVLERLGMQTIPIVWESPGYEMGHVYLEYKGLVIDPTVSQFDAQEKNIIFDKNEYKDRFLPEEKHLISGRAAITHVNRTWPKEQTYLYGTRKNRGGHNDSSV